MKEIFEAFKKSFDDKTFTTSEKRAITQLLSDNPLDKREHDLLRSKIFDLAKAELKTGSSIKVIDWLEESIKTLAQPTGAKEGRSEVYFSPGDACLNAIIEQLHNATRMIDVCVFTISDDRISRELLYCHRKGIKIRIITDNEKLFDMGSDINQFDTAGIPVRVDRTTNHMHHKFAIIDDTTVITGSYNWTRNAAMYNEENILVTDNKAIVSVFEKEFERLWTIMSIL